MASERIYAKIDRLRECIENSALTENEKLSLLRNIHELRGQKVNILITGATGCGKSSTINALFGKETAKVGITPDPDMAMKGRHFDYSNCNPDRELTRFLNEQAESVRRRIREAIGVTIAKPVYYSAEYNYNVDRFYDFIIDHIPICRRKLKTMS